MSGRQPGFQRLALKRVVTKKQNFFLLRVWNWVGSAFQPASVLKSCRDDCSWIEGVWTMTQILQAMGFPGTKLFLLCLTSFNELLHVYGSCFIYIGQPLGRSLASSPGLYQPLVLQRQLWNFLQSLSSEHLPPQIVEAKKVQT